VLYRSRKTESTSREVISYKMQSKWVSESRVQCIHGMYHEIQFCVILSYEEVYEPMIQETGIRQGSNLAPYLFNTFRVDILDYICKENAYIPVVAVQMKPGLLFSNNLAIRSFSINGLQKQIKKMVKFCTIWK
jgi:hypothetical protein